MKGEALVPTANAELSGEKAMLNALPIGNVPPLTNFVPKPDPDQGYAAMKGEK